LPREAEDDLAGSYPAAVEEARALTALVAGRWHVSEAAVTYRLLELGEIGDDTASQLFRMFAARWKAQKARAKADRDPDEKGPTYYITRRSRLGNALLGLAGRALQADLVTHTTAARILGVSPASVDPLLKRAGRTGQERTG
jgi:Zn-dependent peptidase ImmA (M78 family)